MICWLNNVLSKDDMMLLFSLNQVIVTPHDASYSDHAFRRLKSSVMEEALRILERKNLCTLLTKQKM